MTVKPLPEKGYVRATFVIEQSLMDPEVHQLRLASRGFVSGYVRGGWGRHVVFARWLRRNTDHEQRKHLIYLLTVGYIGQVEVQLWPGAFPRIYGLIRPEAA